MGTDAADTRRWALAAAGFGADVYLFILLSLGVWVLLPTVVFSWAPVLVSSGSMSPAIEAGDIILIDEELPADPLAPGAIITYREPGQNPDRLVTHRIRHLDDGGAFVTRGDANDVDDARPVPPERVEGFARLLVPMLGLPIHWARSGQQAALAAFVVTSLLALWVSMAAARLGRVPATRVPEPFGAPLEEADIPFGDSSVPVLLTTVWQEPKTHSAFLVDAILQDGYLFPAAPGVDPEPLFVADVLAAAPPPLTAVSDEPAAPRSDVLSGGSQVFDEELFVNASAPDDHEPSRWAADHSGADLTLWESPTAMTGGARRSAPAVRRSTDGRDGASVRRRTDRARAARRKALQPVLSLLVAAAMIAGGVSLPVTEAAATVTASNLGNTFSTAHAPPQGDPLGPVFVLPSFGGADSYAAGQQPETITFELPVGATTVLDGTATASLRVRPSTAGNPPRSIALTLRDSAGQVEVGASIEQQGWQSDWTELTLELSPDLDVTLLAGETLTLEIEVRRLELQLDGPSVVLLPVVE